MWTKKAKDKRSRMTTGGSTYKDMNSHGSIPLNSVSTKKLMRSSVDNEY